MTNTEAKQKIIFSLEGDINECEIHIVKRFKDKDILLKYKDVRKYSENKKMNFSNAFSFRSFYYANEDYYSIDFKNCKIYLLSEWDNYSISIIKKNKEKIAVLTLCEKYFSGEIQCDIEESTIYVKKNKYWFKYELDSTNEYYY